MNEFLFNVAFDSVYQFDAKKEVYFFVGSLGKFGISLNDSFQTAIAKVRAGLEK